MLPQRCRLCLPTPTRAVEVPAEKPALHFGRYYALVIGNNAYTNLHPLRTAVNDARVIAEMLNTLYGFHVTLLLDVTREEIITRLDQLRTVLTDQDNLLIYYAGHGVLDAGEDRGYWLPVNARNDSRVHWIANTEHHGRSQSHGGKTRLSGGRFVLLRHLLSWS